MRRRARAAAAAAGFALSAVSGAAAADIAPNGVDSCEVLPEGARCYERGVVPGVCVVTDKEHNYKTCRATGAAKAPADATTRSQGAPGASDAPPASAPSAASATPASGGGCSVVLPTEGRSRSFFELSVQALLAAGLFGAAFARRARRRR
jgi:hypothetical protein